MKSVETTEEKIWPRWWVKRPRQPLPLRRKPREQRKKQAAGRDGRSEIGKSFRRERSILRLKKGSNIWDKKSIHTDFASATPSRGGHAGSWSATTTSCFWKM